MKKLFFFLILLFFCFRTPAQHRFIKTVSAPGYGSGLRILTAGNNGWVVFSKDSLRLTRFDNCGFSLWSKKYALPNTHTSLTDFIRLKTGGYAIMTRILTGAVYGSLITMIDSSGNIVWSKSFEDTDYNQFPYTLNEDSQGNIFMYGNAEHVSLNPQYDMICKLDANGNFLWNRFYDHGGIWGGAICTSDDGMLARTGNTFIKTDQNGNVQWTTVQWGNTYHYLRPVEVSDGYIFTGYNNGTNYICFFKMDKQGNPLWGGKKQTNFIGTPSELEKLSSGNFTARFIPGQVLEFDKDLNIVNQGGPDLTSQGIALSGRDIIHLADNTPVMAGLTNSTQEFFIAKMDQNYHTGCDVVPAMTVTLVADTQYFLPTNVVSYTLSVVNQTYQVDTLTVSVTTVCNPPKQLDLGSDTALCQGSVMVLQNLTGDLFDHYTWSTGESTSSITISQAGTYWLFAYDNCQENERSDTVWIHIIPIVAANLGGDLFKCPDEHLILHAPDCDSCSFTWSTGSLADSIKAETEGTYWLKVDNNKGCITSDTVEIDEVRCECFLYVPNAFTPNNDGVNEFFKARYDCDILNFNMKIFNRWGQLVYQSDNMEPGWNGLFKGKAAPEGIYVYLISYTPMLKGKVQNRLSKSGSVALIE